uniref:Uncharacterized protein n=1 Tax=viral metagenome TaxID=1070528 RepID=A0A6C0BJF8_9ZZZZ
MTFLKNPFFFQNIFLDFSKKVMKIGKSTNLGFSVLI